MQIILSGMPGSGKSTVGKQLAAGLRLPFFDLDDSIEQTAGCSISRIFEQSGEPYFRQLESDALRAHLQNQPEGILALGGGTPVFHDNIDRINAAGLHVFLDVSPALLFSRLRKDADHRPLVQHKSDDALRRYIADTRVARLPFYLQCHVHFKQTEAHTDVASELLNTLAQLTGH